jgi:tetratricopeptide (TPR) repeat protein
MNPAGAVWIFRRSNKQRSMMWPGDTEVGSFSPLFVMSTVKLNPIYVALDSHQYSRAVKLCLALPKGHALGQALLAHAYYKSGQRWKALVVLRDNLLFSGSSSLGSALIFPELAFEVQHHAIGETEESSSIGCSGGAGSSKTAADLSGRRKGKKKGPTSTSNKASNAQKNTTLPPLDVLDALEQPRFPLHEDWDSLPANYSLTAVDTTTLDTFMITLQSLRLPLTCFQLYLYASQQQQLTGKESLTHVLQKIVTTGLHCLTGRIGDRCAALDTTKVELTILSHMQAASLQLTRVDPVKFDTSWAAQCALWQLQWNTNRSNDDEPDAADDPKQVVRLQMLPRLAESLSGKLVKDKSSHKFEHVHLYLEALQQQEKYEEMLVFLKGLGSNEDTIWRERQAEVLIQLKDYKSAQAVYEQLLAEPEQSDQWCYWKQLLMCAEQHSGIEGAAQSTRAVLETLKEDGSNNRSQSRSYPSRAKLLVECESCAMLVRGGQGEVDDTEQLFRAIVKFADTFASRATCAFSDLAPYLTLCVQLLDGAPKIAEWGRQLMTNNRPADRTSLRVYIFALKVVCKVVALTDDLQWLPDWKELLEVWQSWQELSDDSKGTYNTPVRHPFSRLCIGWSVDHDLLSFFPLKYTDAERERAER